METTTAVTPYTVAERTKNINRNRQMVGLPPIAPTTPERPPDVLLTVTEIRQLAHQAEEIARVMRQTARIMDQHQMAELRSVTIRDAPSRPDRTQGRRDELRELGQRVSKRT